MHVVNIENILGLNLIAFRLQLLANTEFLAMCTVALRLYQIYALTRRQNSTLTADDVVITDIDSAGTNAVQFSMYIRLQDGVLNGNSLLMAVEVRVTN